MTHAPSTSSPRGLGLRLSILFFIDVAVAAAYYPFLSLHLAKTLHLTASEVALVYAMGPLTAFVGPPLVGYLADRVLPAERSLALIGVFRTLVLLLASRAHDFGGILFAMALVGLTMAPAGVLSFTVAFHHLHDSRSIGKSRVFGTVSWISALWATSAYMHHLGGVEQQLAHTRVMFVFAAAVSALGAVYALTLPHTPPAKAQGAFAFVEALSLLSNRSFRALIAASALAAACLQFHFMLWPLFYTDKVTGLGMDLSRASSLSSIAQLLELGLFPALGLLIRRFGIRRVLLVGLLAWPIRFAAYAAGKPAFFVVGIQILHGVNVVCAAMVSQIAVDRVAPRHARASSHALLFVATLGAGNLLGQLTCGALLGACTLGADGHDWPTIFSLPLALGALATLLVFLGYREDTAAEPTLALEQTKSQSA
ncbi:MAG TPA: MFS transporter [Polyangiaceae bacterium]|nr:MFS transporter [Polyangiaceae bacterium]